MRTKTTRPSRPSRWPVSVTARRQHHHGRSSSYSSTSAEPCSVLFLLLVVRPDPAMANEEGTRTDKKALQDLQNKAKGKGPLNTGTQGIKKSGKK